MFNYEASAELYFGQRGKKVNYRRFAQAAAALKFAIEQLPPTLFSGTFLEVDEERFDSTEIRSLYDHADFPLQRCGAISSARTDCHN